MDGKPRQKLTSLSFQPSAVCVYTIASKLPQISRVQRREKLKEGGFPVIQKGLDYISGSSEWLFSALSAEIIFEGVNTSIHMLNFSTP